MTDPSHGLRRHPVVPTPHDSLQGWEDTGWLPTVADLDEVDPLATEPTVPRPELPPRPVSSTAPTPPRPAPAPAALAEAPPVAEPSQRTRRRARPKKTGVFRSLVDTTLSQPVTSTMLTQSYLLLMVLSALLWLLLPIAAVLLNANQDLPTVRAIALLWFLVGWVPALACLMVGRLVLGLLHDHTQRQR